MKPGALLATIMLAACSPSDVAKTVTAAALGADGGPSLSADVQAGKSNSRSTVGDYNVTDIRVAPVVRDNAFESLNQDNRTSADERTVSADRVETVVVNQSPEWLPWLLAAMGALIVMFGVVGWMSPQPQWLRRWNGQT